VISSTANKADTNTSMNGFDLVMVLSLPTREKRIPANAILATQHLYAVGPALRQPLVDVGNLYSRHLSSLLRRQHFAVKPAHATVSGNRMPNDALLLEKSNLNSSSFCCRHGGGRIPFLIQLERQESTR